MIESDTNQETENIKKKISSNLEGINEKSRNYIKDIISLINKEIGINKIISLIIFGSQRRDEEKAPISDCDLLFIFKDRVSNSHIREIEKYFIALEIKHNFRELRSNLFHFIMLVLQQTTGMFVSHFLTKQKFWEQAIFYKIFRVNRLFSAVFAPRNIVLGNVIQNSTVLYGKDLRRSIKSKIKISIKEMFRSMVMNLVISFFSIIIGPIEKLNPMKYQLEAIKWSLRASNFYCFGDTAPLTKVIERFTAFEKPHKTGKAQEFFSKFMKFRKSSQIDLDFLLRSPVRILKIHIKAILYRRMIKRKELQIPNEPPDTLNIGNRFPLQF
jgi:predicted nucleotidyltransferase